MNEEVLLSYLLVFAVALLVSALVTPVVRLFVHRTNVFLQRPRHISIDTHVRPTPVGGGLAIFVGFVAGLALSMPWHSFESRLAWAGLVLVVFGLLDDSRALRIPIHRGENLLSSILLDNRAMSVGSKLVGQLLAAMLLLAPGLGSELHIPQLFSWEPLNLLVAFVWIIGMINATNFLDIMDGLAAGTSAIAAFGFFFLILLVPGGSAGAAISVALAGGALGFLIHNFEPAKIFMGDAGSQFLGLVLGALALHVAGSHPPSTILPPLVLLGIPLYEMTFTVVIRIVTGKAPWKGSRDHIPLRLFEMAFSVRRIVLAFYAAGVLLAISAIWLALAGTVGRVLIVMLLALVGILLGRWLAQVKVPKLLPQGQGGE